MDRTEYARREQPGWARRLARDTTDFWWSAFFRVVGAAIPIGYVAFLLVDNARKNRGGQRREPVAGTSGLDHAVGRDDAGGPASVV